MPFLSIRLSLRHLQVSVFRTPWPQKRPKQQSGQSDFFTIGSRFFCSFLASLFDHFLTKFWTTFGISLGVSWEPSRASWSSLGRPLHPKALKNLRFFKVFENAAFWLFEAPDGSLGLILPPLWPMWSQSGPRNGSQKWSKKWSKSWLKMTPKMIRKSAKSVVQRGFRF